MVMPLISVTAIGVIAGLVAGAVTGRIGRRPVEGVAAAWLGFLAGATLGALAPSVRNGRSRPTPTSSSPPAYGGGGA